MQRRRRRLDGAFPRCTFSGSMSLEQDRSGRHSPPPRLSGADTGQGNRLILWNIGHLKNGNRPFIVRIPLIPGLTDTDENLDRSAEFLKGAPLFVRVELLPYNRLTGAKYKLLGMNYSPPFDERQEVNINTQLFRSRGIRCESLIF